jgi:RES domain-containing protein
MWATNKVSVVSSCYRSLHLVLSRKRFRTVLDADDLIDEPFVRKLSAKRRDHVDLSVNDHHRVDHAVGEWSTVSNRRGLLRPEALEQVDEALEIREASADTRMTEHTSLPRGSLLQSRPCR